VCTCTVFMSIRKLTHTCLIASQPIRAVLGGNTRLDSMAIRSYLFHPASTPRNSKLLTRTVVKKPRTVSGGRR